MVIRARRRPAAVADDGEPARARDGIVYLFRDRLLAIVMAVAFALLLFMTASVTAEVFFAKDVLDAGDFGYGALLTSWTIGMALGALVLARRFRMTLAGAALVANVVQSVGLGLPTLWLVFAFAMVSWFVGGLAHGLKNVLIRTLIHERVPERLRGRAYAAYNGYGTARSSSRWPAAVCSWWRSARWTLFLAGLIPAAAGLVGLAVFARMRERDVSGELVPEPAPAHLD